MKSSHCSSPVPYSVIDVQRWHLSLFGCSCHIEYSHTEALLLGLMGVGDLHQAIDKIIPPLHTERRVTQSQSCSGTACVQPCAHIWIVPKSVHCGCVSFSFLSIQVHCYLNPGTDQTTIVVQIVYGVYTKQERHRIMWDVCDILRMQMQYKLIYLVIRASSCSRPSSDSIYPFLFMTVVCIQVLLCHPHDHKRK